MGKTYQNLLFFHKTKTHKNNSKKNYLLASWSSPESESLISKPKSGES